MNIKVLIVDDEGPDRKGMAIALGREGFNEVLTADTGDAGIEMAKSFHPEVILIDVVLREQNGFDICRKIKNLGLKSKIIMITGHMDAVNAKNAIQSGANEIIEKSAGFTNVGSTIRDLMTSN